MTDTTVIFPGSFDPFTIGHAAIAERALKVFGKVVIAVGYNEHKDGWMPIEQRVESIRRLYAAEPRIEVVSYTGLTTTIAQQVGAKAILRGVRTMQDYEYEQQMAEVNRQLTGIETVLLFADPSMAHVSSSIVRELSHFGQDITPFLP